MGVNTGIANIGRVNASGCESTSKSLKFQCMFGTLCAMILAIVSS